MKSRIALFLMIFALVLAACTTPAPYSVPENPDTAPEISQGETPAPLRTPTTVATATKIPQATAETEALTPEPPSPTPESPPPHDDTVESVAQLTVLYTTIPSPKLALK